MRGPHDWIGIVATGHTYHETLEALRLLGLRTDDDLRDAGIRLLELGMPVPLDPDLIRQFASGLTEIVVVEEKNPTLEWFVKDALYAQNERPVVTGKHAPDGSLAAAGDRHARGRHDRAAAAGAARAAARRSAGAGAVVDPDRRQLIPLSRQPHAVLLLGLPAQLVDEGARRRRWSAPASGATAW